jgi:hypothetical protein
MSNKKVFELMHLINATDGNPDEVVDAVWDAGYRKPERTASEAALLTIDAFFECDMFGIPAKYWPESWESVLQNELMKVVVGEDFDLGARQVAERITAAGYLKVASND